MTPTLTWTKENSPRWDAAKQAMFGPAELAAVGMNPKPAPGAPVADEWWRVTAGDEIAGYGWLDTEWGDARITFLVAPGRRGRGTGAFILEHLEQEAAARGLNYIYNVVPDTHPDGAWIRNWLTAHGFRESSRGQLRRQVRTGSATARSGIKDLYVRTGRSLASTSAATASGGRPSVSMVRPEISSYTPSRRL